jgi:hypothetical protein
MAVVATKTLGRAVRGAATTGCEVLSVGIKSWLVGRISDNP